MPGEQSEASSRAAHCNRAKLKLLVEPGLSHDVELLAAAPEGGAPLTGEVWVRDRQLGRLTLGSEFGVTTLRLPKELSSDVRLELRFPGAPSCDSPHGDVVARVRQVDTRAVPRE
jgi:hypothetical protein